MAIDRDEVRDLDEHDELAWLRAEFTLPAGEIYLDGNSLGPLPKATAKAVSDVVRRQWGRDLIRSWNTHHWLDLPLAVGNAIAPLIGAAPGEVVAADSTSVNLFKLVAAALRLRPGRPVVLSPSDNFSTDLYIVQGLAELLGGTVELRTMPTDDLAAAIDQRTALVMLTQVDFRTGRLHELAGWTRLAHRHGALILWDLAHSAGALPVDLAAAGADLAVGCGYKYLNGGPGAPAFAYVAARHHDQLTSPLWGWMGHQAPFAFDQGFTPAAGITRLLCGTPPILGLTALACGVELLREAGIANLRRKSIALGELFLRLVQERCEGGDFELASPADPEQRGSQLSLRHPQGYAIVQALIARGVIGDFREPDILRFGLAPAFLRYVDIFDAVAELTAVMTERAWDRPECRERARVT